MMEVGLQSPRASVPTQRLWLRGVCGRDELHDVGRGRGAASLIEALLVDLGGAAAMAGRVGRLPQWQYEQVLAVLYRELYGDEIACIATCRGCTEPLTVTFSLAELCASQLELAAEDRMVLARLQGPDAEGVYVLDGCRFRLPTCDDIAELRGLALGVGEGVLESRCLLGGTPCDAIDRAMELAGPRLDVDIDTACPTCNRAQTVRFAIEEFLCSSMTRERPLVIREVHLLARAYGWPRAEILAMSREDRRAHVRLVIDDLEPRRARA